MSFGSRVKESRLAAGLTQEMFASQFTPPITVGTVQAWEARGYFASKKHLVEICKLLDTTPNYLLQDELYGPLLTGEEETDEHAN